MEFTKEQLITHITRHSDEINRLIKQQSHHDNEYRKKLLAVNEIALKALTAAPIGAFHISDQQVGATTDYIKDGEWPIDNGVIEVYAVPPAPIVPGEMPMPKASKMSPIDAVVAIAEVRGWNAFRAAMLKGGAK
ncbi:TPA: hypothetical protein ACURLD_004307 [Escherichia coli]